MYALGEMDAAERTAFEQQLQHDADARAAVEEIRRTVAVLGPALEAEPTPAPQALATDAIIPGWEAGQTNRATTPPVDEYRRGGSKLLRFPSLYYSVAGLAAAAFAVFFVVRESRERTMLGEPQAVEADLAVAAAPPPPPMIMAPAPADNAAAERRSEAPAKVAAATARRARMAFERDYADRFYSTAEQASSTFPLRIGRDGYAAVREQLRRGERPARASVEVAEMINAFDYAWPQAEDGVAFATLLEETGAPWSNETRLVRVGVKGVGERGAIVARGARAVVEFNPARVRAWRLIGFERGSETMGVRGMAPGETVRGGDTVTALYEIVLAEVPAGEATLATLALSYRTGDEDAERQLTRRLETRGAAFAQASADMKFVTAVAAFGLALRESPMQAPVGLQEIARWAEAGAGGDEQRRELVELVHAAETFLR
ncbi:MAG: hypothetical protein C0518_08205 [Opitutus sp.]|nr:hypothetical protein [Opitutus sp.]